MGLREGLVPGLPRVVKEEEEATCTGLVHLVIKRLTVPSAVHIAATPDLSSWCFPRGSKLPLLSGDLL